MSRPDPAFVSGLMVYDFSCSKLTRLHIGTTLTRLFLNAKMNKTYIKGETKGYDKIFDFLVSMDCYEGYPLFCYKE